MLMKSLIVAHAASATLQVRFYHLHTQHLQRTFLICTPQYLEILIGQSNVVNSGD